MIGERVQVLLVDDERSLREPLASRLREEYGYQVDTAATEAEAWELITAAERPYDVALIDDLLIPEADREPEPRGVELVERIRQRCPETECIVFTGWGMERELPALRAGAYRYLAKPFNYNELAMLIRSAAHQVRLRAIGRAILSERDLDRVLEGIAGAARSLALADESAIVLLEPATGKLRVHATTRTSEQQWKKHFRGRNLSREIIATGQVVRVLDTGQDERVARAVLDSGTRSFVGLPIPGEGENLGVLYVYSQKPGRFEEWGTVAVLQTLAGQAGLAIANAQAFAAEAHRRREAETLREAALALTTTLEPEKVFETILAELQKVVPYDSASVQLLKGDRLEIIGGRGFPNLPQLLGISFPIEGNNPNREVVRSRAPFIVADAPAVYKGFTEEPHVQAGIRGWLGVPMLVGDRLIGMIALDKRTPGFYTEEHARLAQAFAAQAAIAIENARLFSELAEAKEWREALIENAFDAVIAIDQDRKITTFNRRAEEMFGWKSEEMIGLTMARLHTDVEKARQILETVNREGAVSGWEVELKHREGASIPVLLSATLIRDSRGRPIGQAGFLRDLRQVRLFEDRQRVLFKVTQAVTGTLKLDEVLDLVVGSAVAAFPTAQGGSIHLYDEQADKLCMRANTFGYSPEAVEASCFKPDEGVAGWVFLHRQPAVVDDVQSDLRYKKIPHPEAPAQRSMICVPLQVRGQTIGTLSLDNLEHPGAFRDDDVELLSTFADQAAIAIENARLYQEAKEGRDYIRSLYEASSAVIAPIEPKQVLQTMVDTIRQTSGAWRAVVLLVSEGEKPQVLAQSGFDLHLKPATSIRREGVSRQVIQTKQPRFFPDTQAAASEIHPKMIEQGVRAAACLPLLLRDRAIGVLWIHYREVHPFSEVEQQALQVYTGQATIAYDHAQRMQELEQMRRAAEAMSRVFEPRQALQQIVDSAAQVLEADSAVIWSYDDVRDIFIPEELVAVGIPTEELERFREEEPRPGRTADTVMQRGYLPVTDIARPEYDFLGESTRSLLYRIGVQSFQGIALQVGDERLGVLYANYRRLRTFGPEEEKKLHTFAGHAALALKNARLLAQMERTREAAGVIAGVTLQERLDRTLKTIARHTQQLLHSDAVTLYTYHEATGRLGDEWAVEIPDPRAPDSAYPPDKISPASVVWSILNLAEPPYYHLAEDHLPTDPLLGGRFAQEEGMQAAIGIQLRVGEHKVGVMFVNFRSPHRFTADEIATVQLFADQAAVAIRNARQYAEIVRDASLRQGLLRAGRELMALQEPEAVLQNVVSLMQEVLACDVVTLYPYDQDRGEIGFPAYVAGELRDRKSLEELGYVSKESVVGRLLASGEPHFAADAPNDPVMSAGGFVAREGIQSSAGIPLKFGDRVIGIVFVNYRAFHPFPSEEQEALLLFATQAALAIQNARQFEQIRKKTASLEALYEAGKALSGTLALDDILSCIVEQARNFTGRYGQVARFSHLALKEGRWLKFKAACPPECLPGLQKGVGDIDLEGEGPIGVTGRAVKTGESQLVVDVTQDRDYIEYDPETRSELAVPIKLVEEVIGVINVEHSDTHAFDEEERRDLESLAAQAALAIRNARQYEELRRTKGLVGARTALAWMGMASTAWRHAIDKHAVTIREQVELARRDWKHTAARLRGKKIEERLSTIERLAGQILEKPIVPPLSREEGVEPVALNDLVGERARQLWERDPYKESRLHLDLQLPGTVTVRASPEWLRRAFDILVDNAVEATAGREVREITIGTRAADGGAEIRVSDTGPGIAEEIRAKIGLEPIEKPEEAKRLGMGLLMVQTIVQTYGGELRVASTGPEGTTMVIWLPLAAQVRTEEPAHAG